MKIQKYIIPIFVSSNLLGQNNDDVFPDFQFGLTHSIYSSVCFKSNSVKKSIQENNDNTYNSSKVAEIQYGFGLGMFLWAPLNETVIFKPKVEVNFSNSCLKQKKTIYSTCFDFSVSHGFAIALSPANENGVICMARDMSCYLTSKQPYLLIGPKMNFRKFDNGYLNKGFQNEFNLGFFIGYATNYEFHGTNFLQEITYSVSTTAQNQINNSKKIAHTISLALSFY